MDKRNRLSISFKREHRHLFEQLQSVSNKSEYIGRAIEAYMSDKQFSITHEEIRKIVMQILQTQGNPSSTLIQPIASPNKQISDQDIDLISKLF
jgi:hypothetical protein